MSIVNQIAVFGSLFLLISCNEVPIEDSKENTSRVGNIEFVNDYPTEETAEMLRDELKFQAAVQTYLWSFPIANVA